MHRERERIAFNVRSRDQFRCAFLLTRDLGQGFSKTKKKMEASVAWSPTTRCTQSGDKARMFVNIAVTGATGFVGRYLLNHLTAQGHSLRCWYRATSHREGIDDANIQWILGSLEDEESTDALVAGCEAVVHSALWRPGDGFRGAEGDLLEFVRVNLLGSLRLVEASRSAGVKRFVQISTCAVHEQILADRPLDESHPLWPLSHYGAHKAALEKFVHSFGLGEGYDICALRPTGVYGVTTPVERSKWFDLVRSVVRGEDVVCQKGGKEVHASDVAKAIGVLLTAENVAGQSFNCYDRYVSEYEVATLAREASGSRSKIHGETKQPKHQIATAKLRDLGMTFGGDRLLKETVDALVKLTR